MFYRTTDVISSGPCEAKRHLVFELIWFICYRLPHLACGLALGVCAIALYPKLRNQILDSGHRYLATHLDFTLNAYVESEDLKEECRDSLSYRMQKQSRAQPVR